MVNHDGGAEADKRAFRINSRIFILRLVNERMFVFLNGQKSYLF